MRNTYKFGIIAAVAISISLASCEFKNPLEGENGDDINLVRLDLPKFDARYMMRLVDLRGEQINDATAELRLTGTDAQNLITEAGKIVMKDLDDPTYKGYRTTEFGMLNLNMNPNFKIASHPVSFQVNGSDELNPEYIIIPRMITQTVAGDVNTDITAINSRAPMRANRASQIVTVTGGNASYVTSLSGQNGNGYNLVALYKANETKNFSCTDNTGNLGDYGIYLLDENMKTSPVKTGKRVESGRYFIVVAKEKQVIEGKLKIDVRSEMAGVSTSLTYTITAASNGAVIDRGTISGTLPFSATVEQLFVAQSAPQVKVKLEGNSTFMVTDQPQTATISSQSTATVGFNAACDKQNTPDLRRCNISFVGICNTNKQIAFYPTIRFQYSKKDSQRWEWVESNAGKMVMMLETNQDYSIRIPINNTWQSFNITTDQSKIEAMVREQPNVTKFEMVNHPDGSMSLKVEYQDQEFCDLNI